MKTILLMTGYVPSSKRNIYYRFISKKPREKGWNWFGANGWHGDMTTVDMTGLIWIVRH